MSYKKKLSGKIIYIYSFSSRGRKDFYNLHFDTYRLFILMQKTKVLSQKN